MWQAGGTPERAARGKCWIDGSCAAADGGKYWSFGWRGGSGDDEDEAYVLGIGVREDLCLKRARVWFDRCGNERCVLTTACIVLLCLGFEQKNPSFLSS